jgi:hypothetical protein
MVRLQEAYAAWRTEPFPHGGSHDELGELHADLALADTWVAESVIPYVERGVYEPANVDVMSSLAELRARLEALASAGDVGVKASMADYSRYIDLLAEVYEAFLARA